ncbi:MAG TPA: peptidylprolyl isomerase [Vicinamibacterales bacterium]|jgi:cyclophilin family peptidyl-prolyl cis-trans isomerase/HEAT repeat protein
MKLIAASLAGLWLVAQTTRTIVAPANGVAAQVRLFGEPLAVLNAEKAWLGADAFWPLAKATDPTIQRYALRALGRLEDPANVPPLVALAETRTPFDKPTTIHDRRAYAADAVAQSLYRFDPARDPQLIADVAAWFLTLSDLDAPDGRSPIVAPLGSITYGTEEQFHAAERRLLRAYERLEPNPRTEGVAHQAIATLESLVRLNPRFAQLESDTLTRLRQLATDQSGNEAVVRISAFRTLVGRGLDAELELTALHAGENPEIVRLATEALVGTGGGLDPAQLLDEIQFALKSGDRYLGLRGYVRFEAKTQGCGPIVDLLDDPSRLVALEAIDALGDLCKDDEDITKRLDGDLRVPPVQGSWSRETHVFVTMAKRAPEKVALFANAFVTHQSPWVRMYAVRAVVALDDIPRLEKLAYDTDDNVREAALAPLLALKNDRGDPVLIADLGRDDVQLLRAAAILAKAAPADEKLTAALVDGLLRLTSGQKESSRDGRLALIDALNVRARPSDVARLRPLAKDFDPVVAAAAAELLSKLTGSPVKAEPPPVQRGWQQQFSDLSNQCVKVALSSGQYFRMRMAPEGAPIAADRFLKLALVDHYYDRLYIHRLVPNFVVQMGSPGANEYSGHKEYMRDEIALPNTAGSVGLSIRGRNTGDAQFYINLVGNPRLDRGYTIFAHVLDMGSVGAIEEGDMMESITSTRCPGPDER